MFWRLTPREIQAVLDGAGKRIERELRFVQLGAWLTGQLAGLAVNAPDKYPKFERITGDAPAHMDPDEIERNLKMWFTSVTGEAI